MLSGCDRRCTVNPRWMHESEAKKLGPLGLRLVEGLRGDALKLAQQMKMEDLAKPGAPEQLLKMFAENLKPRKAQEMAESLLVSRMSR